MAGPRRIDGILGAAVEGLLPGGADLLLLADRAPTEVLTAAACRIRDDAFGDVITYSRKVFIPLTRLCRDVCHYCSFAQAPSRCQQPYLSLEQVLDIARRGADAGCNEALFTLGDRPESRYRAAREALGALGHESTLSYLGAAAKAVLAETGLLPHVNPGVMSGDEIASLRAVSVSQGLMLEAIAPRLCAQGGPHHGSPDKHPRARLATLRQAGERAVPFTSGILIGIGETPRERMIAVLALRALHRRHGHIQEIIIQNFRAKPDTRMARASEPSAEDLVRTIALARIAVGAGISVQVPPNLSPGGVDRLIGAGIDDFGGISPVTPDHVNPEYPWPHLDSLAQDTDAGGKILVERLAVHPRYARAHDRWIDPALHSRLLDMSDADGFARSGGWVTGLETVAGRADEARCKAPAISGHGRLDRILGRAGAGFSLSEEELSALFRSRGGANRDVHAAADALRAATVGGRVTYVINRNINYTNICTFHCRFCAFSKGRVSETLRDRPYVMDLEEIGARVRQARARGATEICLQGGIHPSYTGQTYLDICAAVKEAAPDIHVHAFSPLEIWHGAETLGLSPDDFLRRLADVGLGSLPGTAAEILDDAVRRIICPDKLTTEQWLTVIGAAHQVGLPTTATIMFGHVEGYEHCARHLLRIRRQQEQTGGITEFVPLPFVAMESPIYRKGRARRGPTYREAVLMHAVARLALHPLIENIQTSWVKMGVDGVIGCLQAGANDIGGTLMNESITRAAGASHGQKMTPKAFGGIAGRLGRSAAQRTTLYRLLDVAD